jgi:hypothetical protein
MSKLKTSYSTISLRDDLSNLYQDLDKNTLYSSILSLRLNSILEMQKNEMHSTIFKNSEENEENNFISRLSIVENLIQELKMYNFVPSIKKFIDENEQFFEENKLEIAVEKTLHYLKNNKNSKFYEKAIIDLKESVNNDNPVFSIVENMKQHNWIPSVKNLYEFARSIKGSMTDVNPNFRVSKIYSPVEPINESDFRFYSSGKILNYKEGEISESNENISEDFGFLISVVESAKITDNNIRFLFNNSILDIHLGEEKKALINHKVVESKNLRDYLINSSLVPYGEKNKIVIFERALEKGSDIKDIDLGYKVTSNVYEGLSCSIFNSNNRIFIQKVNKGMKENSIVEAESPTDAVNIVKNFMNFDISESIKDLIETEAIEVVKRREESEKIKNRITFLMEKLAEVESVESEIGKNKRILEAKKLLEDQIIAQNKKLKVLEGVEIPFTPSMEGPEVGTTKLSSKGDLKAGKEYTIRGKGGYIFVGVSDDVFMFNHKNETDPTPIHMNNVEVESSISSGEITECY